MTINSLFRYEIPTAIEFGSGSIKTLHEHVKALVGKRCLLSAIQEL